MSAGKLNRRVTFWTRQTVSDGGGGTVDAWGAEFARWAGLELAAPRATAEAVVGGAEAALSRAVLTVRDDSDTRRVAASWRVWMEGRAWHVREAAPMAVRGLRRLALEAVT